MQGSEKSDVICGIIMPISYSDEQHTEKHWADVKSIIEEAISRSGFISQPVWEGSSHDIIQTKILQNIFENEIVVCDLSTRNPNVMLEVGIRLTTRKPTILIAEYGTNLPFDTSIIQTEFYDFNLKYGEMSRFIDNLTKSISEKSSAFKSGNYKPYLESFVFERIIPTSVSVSSEERLTTLIQKMDEIVNRTESNSSNRKFVEATWNDFLSASRERSDVKVESEAVELAKALSEFSGLDIGDVVFHEKFGNGVILWKDGNKFEVNFERLGKRRVIGSFLKKVR